jgi:dephospho-CoA kinase
MSTSSSLPAVVGVGGTFASGKDVLAEFLAEEHGYTHVSTSDMVRVAAMERYGDVERPTLTRMAHELRDRFGPGILAERALQTPDQPIVVSGIRTAGEVEAIRAAGGMMVFVDADPQVRYQRSQGRARDAEAELSFDDFLAREQREMEISDDLSDQNIGVVKKMADIYLDNSGDLEAFTMQAIEALGQHQTSPTASE